MRKTVLGWMVRSFSDPEWYKQGESVVENLLDNPPEMLEWVKEMEKRCGGKPHDLHTVIYVIK